jgi:hypothetical protein
MFEGVENQNDPWASWLSFVEIIGKRHKNKKNKKDKQKQKISKKKVKTLGFGLLPSVPWKWRLQHSQDYPICEDTSNPRTQTTIRS